ncbi:hypothetical protein [Flavobacterium aestuarii]|uniref:hypothetical protein n=1 Tax=Flavobacterium aestuarii TaxID=3149227 RepID=UPI0032B4FA50
MNQPEKPKYLLDLNDFDNKEKSIWIPADAKNLERLQHLYIENLYVNGAKEKDLEKILSFVKPKYLKLYNLLAKDLSILESLETTETIILQWNTKSESLWNIAKNVSLKHLEINDFSKLQNIEGIANARQILELTISGGINKALKIESLKPLINLSNLEILSLWNLKIEDDSLRPIGNLKKLRLLEISNQFETKEYAWLAVKMKHTECKMFNAVNNCKITDANGKIVWDTMVTGRRKSFLLSNKDQVKIEKYKVEFEKLKTQYEKENSYS